MKRSKILAAMACILSLAFFSSFKAAKKLPGEYGQWKESSCYKGIDFRVKCAEYNEYAKKYTWYVQIRNRYQASVHLDLNLAPASNPSDKEVAGRMDIAGGSTANSAYYLVAAGPNQEVEVYIDRVRIGVDDASPYYHCDR